MAVASSGKNPARMNINNIHQWVLHTHLSHRLNSNHSRLNQLLLEAVLQLFLPPGQNSNISILSILYYKDKILSIKHRLSMMSYVAPAVQQLLVQSLAQACFVFFAGLSSVRTDRLGLRQAASHPSPDQLCRAITISKNSNTLLFFCYRCYPLPFVCSQVR